MNANQCVLTNVRLSYVHLTKPFSNDPQQAPKYSTTILIPKSSSNKAAIDAAIAVATNTGKTGKWNGVVPPVLNNPVHDGDGVKSDGTPYGPECAGHWVLNASSSAETPIEIVDRNMVKIMDATQIYSGIYANVCVTFYPYLYNGKKGIGCGLGPVQKVSDGEPLGGSAPTAASCFSALGDEGGFNAMGTEVKINPITGKPM